MVSEEGGGLSGAGREGRGRLQKFKRHPAAAVAAAVTIVFKSGCPGCPDSAEDSNFPQKDCLRTRKLSVSVPET